MRLIVTSLACLSLSFAGCSAHRPPPSVTGSPSELGWAHHGGEGVTDNEIKKQIEDAFLYDPQVGLAGPSVSVNEGHVTLYGAVPSLRVKRAAEKDALQINGVTDVNNLAEVLSDTQRGAAAQTERDRKVEHDVKLALALNASLVGNDVDVFVDNGAVTLSGQVKSKRQKRLAEEIAAGTRGATVVMNHIRVG